MDTSRISFGELVAGVSGALLFIFLFLPWYTIVAHSNEPPAGGTIAIPSVSKNAWESFHGFDVVMLIVAGAAVALALMRARRSMPELPLDPAVLVAILGALATVVIVIRIFNSPVTAPDLPRMELTVSRKIGVFLGLLATIGITIGAWMAVGERRREEAPPP